MFIKNTDQKNTGAISNTGTTLWGRSSEQAHGEEDSTSRLSTPGQLYIIKRDGKRVGFDRDKIVVAVTKAYLATEGNINVQSESVHKKVDQCVDEIVDNFQTRAPAGGLVHIEDVQDRVELTLMRAGEQKVARAYVLYREQRAAKRSQQTVAQGTQKDPISNIRIDYGNGYLAPMDTRRLHKIIDLACKGLDAVDHNLIYEHSIKNIYDGIGVDDLSIALIMSCRAFIEKEPHYTYVAARLQLNELTREVCQFLDIFDNASLADMPVVYGDAFRQSIAQGIKYGLINPDIANYDLDLLAKAIKPEQDNQFTYLGIKTLYDRYFLHWDGKRIELPQVFFMRVAMGLALNESDRNQRAIEFYNLLSSFDYMSSTPTLFNSATVRSQLSSCYISTIPDDLEGIYDGIRDNAMLSKWAGGLGNDWTPVRSLGSHIKGTNGKSQGVVPFLKVANDTATAVNQGGKRKGALCTYLESWHLDIEEFLEMRKNTGDDRRRTPDMDTANWVPDLFMKRVFSDGQWTLFSPSDTPDLHGLTGKAFEKRYQEYEAMTGHEITNFKKIPATTLWRKMLSMLFETGHPWITFKDSCNLRSPQQHEGTIHCSNLCTEITLNTSKDEIAVCNLGSVNLANHMVNGEIDKEKLRTTIRTAMRMLDNVIDINYYAVEQTKNSNMRHRPIGLGLMGFQDALYSLRLPYASQEAIEFADRSMELISYYAIEASSDLAVERGSYPSYEGSLWSKGILPIDSIKLLEQERGSNYLQVDRGATLDWQVLRDKVQQQGVRNSNMMAIAPTATISNIVGVNKSIEPTYQNLYATSNLSGEFIMINPHLVNDLKESNLWDSSMVNDIKYHDGSIQLITRIPESIRNLYKTAFEVEVRWLIDAASRRQKWLDQSQSLNLYMAEPDGKQLDTAYKMAWYSGLKTTYYLRTLGATSAEKSTINSQKSSLNSVSKSSEGQSSQVCSLNPGDDECEVCQ